MTTDIPGPMQTPGAESADAERAPGPGAHPESRLGARPRARSIRLSRFYAAGAMCIASSLCFFLTAVVKLPVLLYFPLSRRWSLTPVPGELSMDYYGRSLLALLGGLTAAVLTLGACLIRDRLRRAPGGTAKTQISDKGRGLVLLSSYVATALLLAAGVYAYELYGRTPVPEPLPPGFAPLPPGFPPRDPSGPDTAPR